MHCLNCDGQFFSETGSLVIDRKLIGRFSVHNIEYRKCKSCGKIRYPASTAKIIEKQENKIIQKLIGKLPIESFVGATTAGRILGISRQAMHKNRRIRRGFIYSIRKEGKLYYNKKSIQLYKDTGDGRFTLHSDTSKTKIKYITVQKIIEKQPIYRRNLTNPAEEIIHPIFYNSRNLNC